MFIRALIAFICIAFAVYWLNVRITPADMDSYHKLITESAELRTKRALEEEPAHQMKYGAQKDIYSNDRHLQIKSEQSELILSQKKDKIEASETLKQISIQDEESTFTADEGIYHYPSHQFTAQNNCKLIQGEDQIVGDQIHFDLTGEIVTYENPKGHLTKGPLNFSSRKLIWHKKIGKLYLIDQVEIEQPDHFVLEADHGTLTLKDLEPELLTLEGRVRMISSRIQDKESFAIADTLTYDPKDKTLLLSAMKRVLFWQEGLSLSAPEVLIHPDDQTVEGRGDVHFAFDLEEQNFIDELFRRYL